MQTQSWAGCHVPIITPFRDDYSVDEAGLRKLVNYYIEEVKCDGLVPCGTTGESPTLDRDEHNRVIEIVVEEAAGRVPVMAGTGSNSTKEAIEMTKHAEGAGPRQACRYVPIITGPRRTACAGTSRRLPPRPGCPFSSTTFPRGRDGSSRQRR